MVETDAPRRPADVVDVVDCNEATHEVKMLEEQVTVAVLDVGVLEPAVE